jgi:glycosyltransferase involved in cell wall biosynthesis
MKKKALLLFADLFTTGGIQQYNRHLCDALEKEFPGYEFLGLTFYDSRRNERAKDWRNIKMAYCGPVNWKSIRKIVFILKVLTISVLERPAFLICSHIDLVPSALILKKVLNIKYILLAYGTDVWNVKKGIKYYGLQDAEMIITISRYTAGVLASNGIDEKKIRYLCNTFDSSLFRPRPLSKDLKASLGLINKKIVLTVGRIRSDERYKGHDIMLNALQILDEKYVWLVVGAGKHLLSLKKESKRLGLNNQIRFLGSVDDNALADYYNLCDCFAMPSKGEGFGVVFLEALACGKPVIGGNRDGTREPLMNGKLGFMVNPDNAEEIAQAIDLACSAKEDRTNPGYLIREVETNFGTKIFNKRVREIFSENIGVNG